MDKRIKAFLLGSVPFVAIVVVWQAFFLLEVIPQWLIPSPWSVLQEAWSLTLDGTLPQLVVRSMYNSVPAFVMAFLISLVCGLAIGLSRTMDLVFRPALSALYTVPSLAWFPLVILVFGFTRTSIWALIFISSFTKMIYCVIDGVRGVNVVWMLIGENVGLSSLARIRHIVFPAALPAIMTGLRLGFAASWRSLVGAEMLMMTFGGLGRFMWMGQWNFEFEKVIIGVLVVGLIGIFMERIFLLLERRTLVRWGWQQGG